MAFNLFAKDNAAAQIEAIHRSQAVIEFDVTGAVLSANGNFLAATGYKLEEIVGRPHAIFLRKDEAEAPAYKAFWSALRQGEPQEGQFLRVGKDGSPLWLQAIYAPVLGRDGKPTKIVKFATDITAQKAEIANSEAQIAAIRKSQAVIEFNLDGIILDANENFLNAVGYRLDEIRASITACSSRPSSISPTSTSASGPSSAGANTTRANICASARAAAGSGSRRPTTRSSIRPDDPTRW